MLACAIFTSVLLSALPKEVVWAQVGIAIIATAAAMVITRWRARCVMLVAPEWELTVRSSQGVCCRKLPRRRIGNLAATAGSWPVTDTEEAISPPPLERLLCMPAIQQARLSICMNAKRPPHAFLGIVAGASRSRDRLADVFRPRRPEPPPKTTLSFHRVKLGHLAGPQPPALFDLQCMGDAEGFPVTAQRKRAPLCSQTCKLRVFQMPELWHGAR